MIYCGSTKPSGGVAGRCAPCVSDGVAASRSSSVLSCTFIRSIRFLRAAGRWCFLIVDWTICETEEIGQRNSTLASFFYWGWCCLISVISYDGGS